MWPHWSSSVPQLAPTCWQVRGVHPHWYFLPPPPHEFGAAQLPQPYDPPHPFGSVPQLALSIPQLVGMHADLHSEFLNSDVSAVACAAVIDFAFLSAAIALFTQFMHCVAFLKVPWHCTWI